MGLISLPVSLFLYWVMLRRKKQDPFPKGGLLFLLAAGAVSAGLAALLGRFLSSLLPQSSSGTTGSEFLLILISTFVIAGLLEECLKFLTCRLAISKEGMVRTWMDSVIAFSVVGITFGIIEDIVYGMSGSIVLSIARALAPAHFLFGLVMGYFYGKYRVSGQKKYLVTCIAVPVIVHTISNAFLQSVSLSRAFLIAGLVTAISFFVAAIVAVIIVFRWQKKGTLDVPVLQK